MLGFPKKSEIRKPLHKSVIFDTLKLNNAQQERVNADISRLYFVNEISPLSVGISEGQAVKMFHVILVSLKHKEYDDKTIAMLFRLIDSNMILVLEHDGKSRVAIYHGKLIQTEWKPSDDLNFVLQGLDLDAVWNNLIIQIGDIQIAAGNTLDEQIAIDERRKKLLKEIERLEKFACAEKQPKKKFEIVQQINKLKSEMETL